MKIIGDTSGSTTYYGVFNPTVGGRYYNGSLQDGPTSGYWWGAGVNNGARRYRLYNDSSVLITNVSHRYVGYYIRCVSEEKDVSDLTYMQDMTPSIATFAAERTALPTILQELCVIVNVLRA